MLPTSIGLGILLAGPVLALAWPYCASCVNGLDQGVVVFAAATVVGLLASRGGAQAFPPPSGKCRT
ncbi:hypothetical protein ACFWN1_11865 [Streptomyces sp. NPDC058459]|uniref:hypothetical protein n=1 Tax=Streptomyces sp. NPDC058459 TaxID=3346508 RepID=UPI00366557AC